MGFPWALAAGSMSTAVNVYGQRNANETNIKLARENRAWEEGMSNTAVQRRADDIEKAGGNRALAFTTGSEATTPQVTPATVRPLDYGDLGGKIMTGLQMAQMKAQTRLTSAQAGSAEVEEDIRKSLVNGEVQKRMESNIQGPIQEKLRTEIMRSQAGNSALENRRLEGTVTSMIQMATQQARAGQLDLEAMERIAKLYGLDATKAAPIIRMIMDALTSGKGLAR